jgi:hypothetical protein
MGTLQQRLRVWIVNCTFPNYNKKDNTALKEIKFSSNQSKEISVLLAILDYRLKSRTPTFDFEEMPYSTRENDN